VQRIVKKEKVAFGIFQDGLSIKIAQLRLHNGNIIVDNLNETLLSTPFFKNQEEETEEISKLPPEEVDFTELDEVDESSLELDVPSDIVPRDNLSGLVAKKDESLPGLKELQNFLQVYPLEKGKIAVNANDEQITYFQFDASFAKSKAKLWKKLKETMLSPDELKKKDFILDYIINPNKSGLAFVHRGKLSLFHALRDINLVLSKERYFYSHVDTNEFALINLVRNNYECSQEDYVLLLYIGIDYKVGIVMREGVHIKTFPIIVPETDAAAMRQAIYSKIILEQDISDMQITKNVILIGDHVTDEDLEYFRNKTTDEDQVHRLVLPQLKIPEELASDLTDEKIARYAIPISLAWKTLDFHNKKFYPSNLLPAKVIENQKYFKIVWHGFVIMALIFYFTFSGTMRNLQLKKALVEYEQKNYAVESDLRRNRGLITKLNEIKTKLSALETNFQKVEVITGNHNLWYYILEHYSQSLERNPRSWLGNISNDKNGFSVTGYTTNRRSIIEFSQLFPQGNITSIIRYDIEELVVWQFMISYNYPDTQEIKASEELILQPSVTMSKESEEDAARILNETEPDTTKTTVTEETSEVFDTEANREYRHTLDVYFAGDYQSAIKLLNSFLGKYGNHPLAYNATYYKGECLYLLKRYNEAMEIFQKIFQERGKKAPDALLMLGNSWEKMGDKNMARASWNNLIADYPTDELSVSAKYKLNKLEK